MTGNRLPFEIPVKIFSNLHIKILTISTAVCKDWYSLIKYNEIWTKYFPKTSFNPKGIEFNQQVMSSKIHSVFCGTDLRKKFYYFLKELKIHQIGIFKCIFPFNPTHSLEIKVQFKCRTENTQEIQKICCYERKLSDRNLETFISDNEMSNITFKAKLNSSAKKFFASTEALTYTRFLKMEGVKVNKYEPINWTRVCAKIIFRAFCIFVLIPNLFRFLFPISKGNFCTPPSTFNMSLLDFSYP
jgi:hypothetical protein